MSSRRSLSVRFVSIGGRTVMTTARAEPPFTVSRHLDPVIIGSTSGALCDGDELDLEIVVEAGARARVAMGAAQLVQARSEAVVRQRFVVAGGLDLDLHTLVCLPGSRAMVSTVIDLKGAGWCTMAESIVAHRPIGATNEPWALRSRTEVRWNDARLALDHQDLSGEALPTGALHSRWSLGVPPDGDGPGSDLDGAVLPGGVGRLARTAQPMVMEPTSASGSPWCWPARTS